MTRLEMVEKIREKTGVTYEEACEALEKANWDMLDAVVTIEKEHPAKPAQEEAAKSNTENVQETTVVKTTRRVTASEIGDKIASVLKWIGNIIRKGYHAELDEYRDAMENGKHYLHHACRYAFEYRLGFLRGV